MEKIISPNFRDNQNILCPDSPSFSGILTGECHGDVWIDDSINPTLAFVYSYPVGGFAVMGSIVGSTSMNDIEKFLKEDLFKELKMKGFKEFEFSVQNKTLEEKILDIFSKKKIKSELEYVFTRYESVEVQSNSDFQIAEIDDQVLADLKSGNYENTEFANKRLLESWGSYTNFKERSLGFIALKDREIAGVIIGTGCSVELCRVQWFIKAIG